MRETQRTRDTRRKGRDDGAGVWLEQEQQTARARRSDIKAANDKTDKTKGYGQGQDRGQTRSAVTPGHDKERGWNLQDIDPLKRTLETEWW